MGLNGGQLELLHKGAGSFTAAGQTKADHAAAAIGQILFSQCVVGAGLQAAVIHIGHLGMAFEELCHSHAVGAVALHPDMQAFQAEVQHIGIHRGLHGAEVPHQLSRCLGDKGTLFAEAFGVSDAVVAVVRGAQAGELLGVGHPVELAAVHDGTAQHCAVAVHVLGGGVSHDIRAPLKGAAVDRRGEGVVHDQGHAVGVSSLGKLLDIQHGQGGVGNGLAEHHLGVRPEGSVQLLLGAQRVHKGGLNAHLLHGDGNEVEGAAVDGAGCHDMVTGLAEVEQGKEVGGLTTGGQHGGGAALQLADLLGHKVTGGVLQAGVEVAVGFQVEQLAHILAGGIFEGGGLDDGDLAGLAIAGRITALHTDGITVHCNILLYWVCPNSTIPRRSTCLRRGIETLNFTARPGRNEERTPSVKAFRLCHLPQRGRL